MPNVTMHFECGHKVDRAEIHRTTYHGRMYCPKCPRKKKVLVKKSTHCQGCGVYIEFTPRTPGRIYCKECARQAHIAQCKASYGKRKRDNGESEDKPPTNVLTHAVVDARSEYFNDRVKNPTASKTYVPVDNQELTRDWIGFPVGVDWKLLNPYFDRSETWNQLKDARFVAKLKI